ncbi:MAG TPA: hypothetical protein VI056_05385 [Candidatus Limnocylindria bacterium]
MSRFLTDQGEVVEAATVVAGFNFANRVADGLGVPCEIPDMIDGHRIVGRLARWAVSTAMRVRMNFAPLDLRSDEPAEVLATLSHQLRESGAGPLPSYFARLAVRPHILAGQAALTRALLTASSVPRRLRLAIQLLTGTINGDGEATATAGDALGGAPELRRCVAAILRGDAIAPDAMRWEALREARHLEFARDLTRSASTTTDAQVLRLKQLGTTDVEILDLVLLTAAQNAANRLNVALAR